MRLQDESLAAKLRVPLERKGLRVIPCVAGWEQLAAIISLNQQACLVLELDDKATDGLLFCEQMKASGSQIPIIVLAAERDYRVAVRALRAGVIEVLGQPPGPAEFLAAIDQALAQARERLERRSSSSDLLRRVALLTSREREILQLILRGLMNKEIADQMRLALVTVKVHRGNLMRKIGARTAADLARLTLAMDDFLGVELCQSRA